MMKMEKFNKRLKLWILYSDCFVCRQRIDDFYEASIEHIIPKSKGGSNSIENLSISHKKCNNIKADSINPEEWLSKLENLAKKSEIDFELEKFESAGIWRSHSEYFLLNDLINTCFFDLDFVFETIDNIPRIHAEASKNFGKKKRKFSIFLVHLRKVSDLNLLIAVSNSLDQSSTQEYWRLFFGILFLEKYRKQNNRLAYYHATWRLESLLTSNSQFITDCAKVFLCKLLELKPLVA